MKQEDALLIRIEPGEEWLNRVVSEICFAAFGPPLVFDPASRKAEACEVLRKNIIDGFKFTVPVADIEHTSQKARAMNPEQIRMQIMAVAYAASAVLGTNEAIRMLEAAAAALRNDQWSGPANR